jgi:hypothetical protein
MTGRFRYLLAAASVLTVVSCAQSMRWDKAGTSDDDISFAIQDCHDAVAVEMRSWRMRNVERFDGAGSSAVGIDSASRSAVQDRFREADYRRMKTKLFERCMHSKGFRQIPADAPKPKAPVKPQVPLKT